MPCSPQPNREFARAPTLIFVCDNPSGRAFERMGQIHMRRANPFGALLTGPTARVVRHILMADAI